MKKVLNILGIVLIVLGIIMGYNIETIMTLQAFPLIGLVYFTAMVALIISGIILVGFMLILNKKKK